MTRKRRTRNNPENGGAGTGLSSRQPAGGNRQLPTNPPDAAETEPIEIPEGYHYGGDPRHGKIVVVLGEKVDYMIEEARQNRDSEANQLVRALLLNQLGHMDPAAYNGDSKLVLGEERQRDKLRGQFEMDHGRVKQFERREAWTQRQLNQSDRKLDLMQKKLDAYLEQMGDVSRVARNAQISLEHDQPMDPRAVYTRIAEIVGLQAPQSRQQEQ